MSNITNLTQYLSRQSMLTPDKEAIKSVDGTLTFNELYSICHGIGNEIYNLWGRLSEN